jgi:hypothetical protein
MQNMTSNLQQILKTVQVYSVLKIFVKMNSHQHFPSLQNMIFWFHLCIGSITKTIHQ